ncbi:MAG: helix-turn-helix transcriptional regulator [Erysipelotrichaceae bacterium]|nr:helix-turn-helix transcriptional regulator [Erysipelotrichaceae bacterium]MCI9312343.1 helix-turn-helix transcriptional regulator [Erysipelotrichaceae bacterium]
MKKKGFGEYLNQQIHMRNMTQKEVAELLHVSPQTVNNYVLNKRVPDLDMIIQIIDLFHMDINKVFHLSKKAHTILPLSKSETKLIRFFRIMDKKSQQYFLQAIINQSR